MVAACFPARNSLRSTTNPWKEDEVEMQPHHSYHVIGDTTDRPKEETPKKTSVTRTGRTE
jgi:hypothetical protein